MRVVCVDCGSVLSDFGIMLRYFECELVYTLFSYHGRCVYSIEQLLAFWIWAIEIAVELETVCCFESLESALEPISSTNDR